MAYLKPPAFTRHVFNPLAMRFGIGGTKTLAVRRRRSGEMQRVPVIPLEYDGGRYVVSTRGESDWVRNLRAAGEAELGAGDSTERVQATEVPAAERPPILAAYRKAAGKTVESYFKKLPDPADHPVFRIESR
jgi:deazaflavin-dependent oxidoreductase (nitroreductase family)